MYWYALVLLLGCELLTGRDWSENPPFLPRSSDVLCWCLVTLGTHWYIFRNFVSLLMHTGLLEIGHDDNIYTMEIGECCKSGSFYFSFQWVGVKTFISTSLPADTVLGIQSGRQKQGEGTKNWETLTDTGCVLAVKTLSLSELLAPHLSHEDIGTDLRGWLWEILEKSCWDERPQFQSKQTVLISSQCPQELEILCSLFLLNCFLIILLSFTI